MSQVINTNIPSINAQRNLSRSGSELATALQRLSSGLRINSAKDDAAGLAISERFSTQIRGLAVAVRNANDGISLSQTAEGALAEVTSNLQRIRELAVQARNATNSASDRAALDAEVQQRLAEIDRTAAQTSFNGQKILDGTFGRATFQVGANAGETISLTLDSSMRLGELGTIASANSGALGSVASGGSYTVTATDFNFGTVPQPATAGRASFQIDATDFSAVDGAGSSGSVAFTAAAFNFSSGAVSTGVVDATVPALGGANAGDFSGAGDLAQFDVQIGAVSVGVTLNANYGSVAGVAAAVQSQLQAVSGFSNVTVVEDPANAGQLLFTNVGSATPINLVAGDGNADSAGITAAGARAGSAGSAQPNATFAIDGQQITLSGNYTDATGLAAEIQTQLVANPAFAAYTVSNAGNIITIDNGANGGSAVTITGANASANQGGISNTTGTAGVATTQANNGGFEVDGNAIVLDQAYGSYAAVAAAIQSQLDTAVPGGYAVTVDAGGVTTISRTGTGAASTAVVIGNEVINTATTSTFSALTSAAGADAIAGTAATFQIDGTTVTLDQNYGTAAALRAAIGAQLPGYTISGTGNDIVFTSNTLGSGAVTLGNASPSAFTAGLVNGTGTAGSAAGSITLAAGELTITDAAGTLHDVQGTYASVDELAESINAALSGVFAAANGSSLQIRSSREFTIGGTQAAVLGFTPGLVPMTNGSLTTVNVLSQSAADDAIVRVDAALTEVSGLRSNFGAIQNRFESTIANLQITSENLTASRSRILDADFAVETANLTRGQILQQAGTAILAQANQLPQNVLSLLRG